MKNKVAYFYDSDVGIYHYSTGHPMRPHRIRMTDTLIKHYDLYSQMIVLVSAISFFPLSHTSLSTKP